MNENNKESPKRQEEVRYLNSQEVKTFKEQTLEILKKERIDLNEKKTYIIIFTQ